MVRTENKLTSYLTFEGLYGHFGTRTLRYQDSSSMVPKCLEALRDHTRTVRTLRAWSRTVLRHFGTE